MTSSAENSAGSAATRAASASGTPSPVNAGDRAAEGLVRRPLPASRRGHRVGQHAGRPAAKRADRAARCRAAGAGCGAASASPARPASAPRAAAGSATSAATSPSSASISARSSASPKISRAGDVRAGDVRDGAPGLLAQAEHERRAGAVDQRVHDAGRDDLAAQRVVRQPVARSARGRRSGSSCASSREQARVVGQLGGEQLVVEPDLRVGEQDRELGRWSARRRPRRARPAPRPRAGTRAPRSSRPRPLELAQ